MKEKDNKKTKSLSLQKVFQNQHLYTFQKVLCSSLQSRRFFPKADQKESALQKAENKESLACNTLDFFSSLTS